MKTILYSLLFLCIAANAQQITELRKPVKCSEVKWVMNNFYEQYGEQPIWVSKTEQGSSVALLHNPDTKTWTLIEYSDELACILDTGRSNSKPINN